jgi:uncharacterized protein (TIGR02231 family)
MTDTPVVDTRVTLVTLFEDRAELVRVAAPTVGPGRTTLELGGLTPLVDDPSVVVVANTPGVTVLARKVLRRLAQRSVDAGASDADALEAARRARDEAAWAVRAAEAEHTRAQAQLARAEALADAVVDAIMRVPRGPIDVWTSGHAEARMEVDAALRGAVEAERAVHAAREAHAHAEARYAAAGTVDQALVAVVGVELERAGAATGPITLELRYRTACAAWRPEHVARLDGDAPRSSLELRTRASVWQQTGERWADVALRLSTARPARHADPPALAADVLSTQRRADRSIHAEARDEAIAVTGVDGVTRRVDEMPGVDDGGEALWLDVPGTHTLPSGPGPTRVELGVVTLDVDVDRVAYPERSLAVHVRARGRWTAPWPLFAGPVFVSRGRELVGRLPTRFVGQGEAFELGLGVDDGLRVRRRIDEKRETTALTGRVVRTRTLEVFIGNLSSAPRALTIVERVPVSELEAIEVALTSAEPSASADADGFVRVPLELGPRGTRAIELVHTVSHKSDVHLDL